MLYHTFYEISDEAFAYAELKQDLVFPHIPKEKLRTYIQCGICAGKQAAVSYHNCDLEQLLISDGVKIHRTDTPPAMDLHAQIEYDAKLKQLDLFTVTEEKISSVLNRLQLNVAPDQVEQIFLAHEFYHWLEYSGHVPACAGAEPVSYKVLGCFPRQAILRRESEIAAHTFARYFCGLPFHPQLPDYILVTLQAGQTVEDALVHLQELECQYRTECL